MNTPPPVLRFHGGTARGRLGVETPRFTRARDRWKNPRAFETDA